MKNEFITAISQLAAEKNLPKDVVFEAVEMALASAYKKDNLAQSNVIVKIHPDDGTMDVFTAKTVVPPDELEDDKTQMTVEEAREFKPDAKLGDTLEFPATPANAGRIAAQTAKQVVLQRLRDLQPGAKAFGHPDARSGLPGAVESTPCDVPARKTERGS